MKNPPPAFQDFVKRFPKIGEAWDLITEEGAGGPLDERTTRLVKLGVAIGALRQGAVHSGVRKALAADVTAEEMEQIVALAASTIGLPSAVAVYCWIHDELDKATRSAF